jgi:excisionase family DNA binding protein
MPLGLAYGKGTRMLTLEQLCEWLNITERHARKLVERDAIPYRKVGHLLRFPESEVEAWSRPRPRHVVAEADPGSAKVPAAPRRPSVRLVLPKSLIEWPIEQEDEHGRKRSA